ncbi:MAG TPA: helix-turn-helix domain-containing GNAT family N-acetyltransferase [Rhodanobacteraceae bacterium]|nr:helix-turn-helix domain-containing GNAT family N-acetyltransferase [Rhodanobacteraceae bacterium]
MSADVQRIRAFNRTVAQRLGVLNEKYLGRDRPYVESRLLFEIGRQGADVRTLRARLGMDSGHLSRVLRALERKGLAITRPSIEDGRVRTVRLSRAGLAELRRIDALSDRLARSMLQPLSDKQAQRLVSAMSEVESLLRASSVEIAPVDPESRDARHCLDQYFSEIDARFAGGFDGAKDGTCTLEHFRPPRGCMLVARLFGEPMGCGALRTLESGIGEIKRMWISPGARGLGIGRRLLAELERMAKKRRMRAIRLDTNESLGEALHLYRSAGYREIPRFNDNPYAHHWFEKSLR